MTSTEPLSSTALSATIWDIDPNAYLLFGDSPYNSVVTPPPSSTVFGKKLASVMDYMRYTIWPAIFNSLNLTQIQIIYRSQSIDPSDVLNVTTVEMALDIYGVIMGPSAKNIERGLLIASDFECLVAANDLTSAPTAKRDAVRYNGVNYDIIGVLPCPSVPPVVGYRFFLRRAI